METVIVIMIKDKKTGLFQNELLSLSLTEDTNFILNTYATKESGGKYFLFLKLTTKEDVQNWEYNAIYDHYDTQIFKNLVLNIYEKEDEYNPTWEVIIEYDKDTEKMKELINKILYKHKKELDEVFEIIKDKQGEYTNE